VSYVGGKLLGYCGKVLYIDLSKEKTWVRELSEEEELMFIGGTGLAAKIVCEEVDPSIDPFSPENTLVFMTGPLTGTYVPCTGRFAVAAKSPLTLGWGEAHSSGFWGIELKKAGFDGVVVKGSSKDPVYIHIKDSEVEIRDASKIWGKDTRETDKLVKQDIGDDKVKVACIGPAGEKLVRYACIAVEPEPEGPRVAGRTGMGAVMGSKKLKAIAVKGSGSISMADPNRLRHLIRRLLPLIMSFPSTQIQAAYGTAGEVEVFYEYGDMPIKNFSLGAWEGIEKLKGESLAKTIVVKHRACYNCPIGCWRVVEVDGLKVRGPEYEAVASLGSTLLIDDPHVIAKANELCNRYGIDVISTGVTIAWAIECYEKGIITKEDTGGLELKWGDGELLLKLIKMISEREGFGKLLGEGSRLASKTIGRGSEKYAMHVKGLEVPMHDPRAFKGMGLQYATSNRGACHLQGFVLRIEQGERMHDLKIYERVDRFAVEGKGRIVAIMQDWHEVLESMIICKFLAIPPAHVAAMYSMVTGRKTLLPELLKAGARSFNLKRLFNIACGYTSKDDTLPERLLKEPLKEGGAAGQVVELEPMLKEYYEYRKWDENGVPTKELLEDLGLKEIGEKLLSKVR